MGTITLKFLVVVKDESGAVVYQETVSGVNIKRKYQLNTEELATTGLTFEIIGKGNKERLVPMGEFALEFLNLYLIQSRPVILNGKASTYVFVTHHGTCMTRIMFWYVIKKMALIES